MRQLIMNFIVNWLKAWNCYFKMQDYLIKLWTENNRTLFSIDTMHQISLICHKNNQIQCYKFLNTLFISSLVLRSWVDKLTHVVLYHRNINSYNNVTNMKSQMVGSSGEWNPQKYVTVYTVVQKGKDRSVRGYV